MFSITVIVIAVIIATVIVVITIVLFTLGSVNIRIEVRSARIFISLFVDVVGGGVVLFFR